MPAGGVSASRHAGTPGRRPQPPAAEAAPMMMDASPRSPQFGGGADSSHYSPEFGRNSDSSLTHACESSDDDALRAPGCLDDELDVGTPRGSHAEPFDKRVRNVRSKIQEMMSAAREETAVGSGQQTGGAPAFDEWPQQARRHSLPAAPPQSGPLPAAAAVPPSFSGAQQESQEDVPRCRSSSVPRIYADSGSFIGGASSGGATSSTAGLTKPGREGGSKTKSTAVSYAGAVLFVGRDSEPCVGDRVRVADERVARFVSPTGRVIEVRCNGERVRVQHDGPEQAQRYYSTGKGGEYHLLVDQSAESSTKSREDRSDLLKSVAGLGLSASAAGAVAREAEGSLQAARSSKDDADSPPSRQRSKTAASEGRRSSSKAVAKSLADGDDAGHEIAAPGRARFGAETGELASAAKAEVRRPKAAKAAKQPDGQLKKPRAQPDAGSLEASSFADVKTTSAAALAAAAEPAFMPAPRVAAAAPFEEPRLTATGDASASASSGSQKRRAREKAGDALETVAGTKPPGSKSGSPVESTGCPVSGSRDSVDADPEALFAQRLRNLEDRFMRDLDDLRKDARTQTEAAERRIVATVLEEVEKRLQTEVEKRMQTLASSAVDQLLKSKLPLESGFGSPSRAAPQELEPPVQEEPDAEAPAAVPVESLLTPSAAAAAAGRASGEAAAPPPKRQEQVVGVVGTIAKRDSPKPAADFSFCADVAADLSAAPPKGARKAAPLGRREALTLPASKDAEDDGLDAEMERLADFRRFASSVLNDAGLSGGSSSTRASTSQAQSPTEEAAPTFSTSRAKRQSPQRLSISGKDKSLQGTPDSMAFFEIPPPPPPPPKCEPRLGDRRAAAATAADGDVELPTSRRSSISTSSFSLPPPRDAGGPAVASDAKSASVVGRLAERRRVAAEEQPPVPWGAQSEESGSEQDFGAYSSEDDRKTPAAQKKAALQRLQPPGDAALASAASSRAGVGAASSARSMQRSSLPERRKGEDSAGSMPSSSQSRLVF
eukprot:TRINITY_DN90475_c0_g1_i1.p1 TRINITY_DN90475_c0_g1~~TRINITY_DN90475_c0_g1_i1.p1  ORF type:complete len:1004 (-),score=286.61 TRINITY_DN90475_c0_g1_i1:109-3120(-)